MKLVRRINNLIWEQSGNKEILLLNVSQVISHWPELSLITEDCLKPWCTFTWKFSRVLCLPRFAVNPTALNLHFNPVTKPPFQDLPSKKELDYSILQASLSFGAYLKKIPSHKTIREHRCIEKDANKILIVLFKISFTNKKFAFEATLFFAIKTLNCGKKY